MADSMTRKERDDLARLVRREEKLAKEGVEQRAAELFADFTQQLHTIYDPFDEEWREVLAEGDAALEQINAKLEAIRQKIGVPKGAGHHYARYFISRTETATAERRAELRAVAKTRIEALSRRAKTEIEQWSVNTQKQLVAGGLETEEARQFLASMPSARQLMPLLDVTEIEGEKPQRTAGVLERLAQRAEEMAGDAEIMQTMLSERVKEE